MDLVNEIEEIIERVVGIKYIHTGIGSYEEIEGCDVAARMIAELIDQRLAEGTNDSKSSR